MIGSGRFICWILCALAYIPLGCAQTSPSTQSPDEIHVRNPEFDQKLSSILRYDVPVISIDSFHRHQTEFYLLDIRTPEEFQTSRIEGAHFINADAPDPAVVQDLPRNTPIVVYCSIGYRSEEYGRKLMEMGFTSVYNLYGSIFEWVNEGHPVVNAYGQPTNRVHTYSRRWSRYLTNPDIQKTW